MLATVEDRLSDEQVESFHDDGFLIIEEGFLSDASLEALRERFDASSPASTRPASRPTR